MDLEGFSIVPAKEEDLKEVITMIKSVVLVLNAERLTHWNDSYPTIETFREDLLKNSLFLLKLKGRIIGTVVLSLKKATDPESREHREVDWKQKNRDKYMMVSRLAVDPGFQRRGFAMRLMGFAEEYAINKGYLSVRLDTVCSPANIRTIGFYERLGYDLLGFVHFKERGQFFAMMEKVLITEAKL